MAADTTLTPAQQRELARVRALTTDDQLDAAVAAVRAITDPVALVRESSAWIRAAQDEINVDQLRNRRVAAAMHLLIPWNRVTAQYDPQLAALRKPLADARTAAAARRDAAKGTADRLLAKGQITQADREARVADAKATHDDAVKAATGRFRERHGRAERELLATRKEAMAGVKWEPKQVYEGLLGVVRSTWTAWQSDARQLPFPDDETAQQVAVVTHRRITQLTAFDEALRAVRDPVMRSMFVGEITHSDGARIMNMEVAAWSGISQPAITQLRRRWGVPDEEASARNRMNRTDPARQPPARRPRKVAVPR